MTQENTKFCANGTVSWKRKSGVPPRSSVCSGKFPFDLRVPFTFLPEILAKWKAPQVGYNGSVLVIMI